MGRSSVVVQIVTESTGNIAPVNTRNALIDIGFDQNNVNIHHQGSTPPECDVIVICRGIRTQELYDNVIKEAFESGTPVIFGSANVNTGEDVGLSATFADLTGGWMVLSQSVLFLKVTNNTHPITLSFNENELFRYVSDQDFRFALPDGDDLYDSALCDLTNSGGDNLEIVDVVPIEAGHIDLKGNPTPARCVLFGNVYGRVGYTEDGKELIGAAMDWVVSAPQPSSRTTPLMWSAF